MSLEKVVFKKNPLGLSQICSNQIEHLYFCNKYWFSPNEKKKKVKKKLLACIKFVLPGFLWANLNSSTFNL